MLSVTNKPFMPSVTIKPFIPSVSILNVVAPVIEPNRLIDQLGNIQKFCNLLSDKVEPILENWFYAFWSITIWQTDIWSL